MTETYNFETTLRVEGTVKGYSKLDAYNSIKYLAHWSYEMFEDSLPGRVEEVESHLKVDTIVPKAPTNEQVILPDNRMWLP
jgi:hypothetical protein